MRISVTRLGHDYKRFGIMTVKAGQDVLKTWSRWMIRKGYAPGMKLADLTTHYKVYEYDLKWIIVDRHDDIESFVLKAIV